MRIIDLDEIRANLDLDAAVAAIRDGFTSLAAGKVQLGAVGHLRFPDLDGDCHIKSAAMAGSDVFAVKVATGFPHNAERGLKTSDGMMTVFDAHTGEPLCLLRDRGYLTDLRTAIAGGLAASLIRPPACDAIGIVGAGIQARFQAELASRLMGVRRVLIWARDPARAECLAAELEADGLEAESVSEIAALANRTRLVIAATPARAPLLRRDNVVPGMRIVAMGSDAPGKQEVEAELVASMDLLVADAADQCLEYGELASPARDGLIERSRISEFGALLANPPELAHMSSALVDLTGVGVQDLQIAAAVWRSVETARRRET